MRRALIINIDRPNRRIKMSRQIENKQIKYPAQREFCRLDVMVSIVEITYATA